MRGSKRPSELGADERDRLRAEYGDLFDQVSVLLFERDPTSINFEDNTDEYDVEAATILPQLRYMTSAETVRTMVHGEFVRWFDAGAAGPESRYATIADEIRALWMQHPLSRKES